MGPAPYVQTATDRANAARLSGMVRFPNVEGIERRIYNRALKYWNGLVDGHDLPTLHQVTPESAPGLWGHLFVIRVDDKLGEYTYVQVGDVLCRALGLDPTGKNVAEILPPAVKERMLNVHHSAVDWRKPIQVGGEWPRPDRDGTVLYRIILLPLSDDQEHVN
jgi:hypothetical protein